MENKYKQFKPFDRVLVRGNGLTKWEIELYSHFDKERKRHETMCHYCDDDCNILPYEGNEGLLGTTHEPEEEIELKHGEWIVLFDKEEMGYPPFFIGQFTGLHKDMFIANEGYERELVIRFSDFDPNDMEETRKHILCLKNGRIIRYKE